MAEKHSERGFWLWLVTEPIFWLVLAMPVFWAAYLPIILLTLWVALIVAGLGICWFIRGERKPGRPL